MDDLSAEVYVSGGQFGDTARLINIIPNFRNGAAVDHDTILINTSSDGINFPHSTFFDDVYVTPGKHLTVPSGGSTGPSTTLAVAAGSTTIEYDGPLPSGADVGKLVFDDGGNELGKIASVSGSVITLEAALAAAIPAGSTLTFVEDTGGAGGETAGKLINISTRGNAGTGDDVLIGGFVIGEASQDVMVFARAQEIPGLDPSVLLADPILTITNPATGEVVATNDDWEDTQGTEINDAWGGFPPVVAGSTSAGIIVTLTAGPWTGTVEGKDGATGLVIFEVFEID